ncbi:unnamed protein product [Rotaria magnacalcarata]|uniref:Uncharacterized protein n=3 Tax=Rotaria TaxID=231623 RepID=A0A818Z684_9BILA|nr:unnamed protein product [Rotaria magnacalcarata]CAF1537535.1 unnamed protein product [Rotaria magnacalcarata]CAF1978930.1 unnamed protein product [Rotaria magnacalcarata]CAF2010368.1 unnamed protein product [Rotaria magnacalcarata]CAF3759369.1 unnamed protein product [Rotaria magnacalcarata]
MSTRRRSVISHGFNRPQSRASIISLYSAAYDDDKRRKLSRVFSAIFVHKKIDIYHVLERQEGTRTLAYHLFVFALTLVSLVFGSILTIDEWRPTLDAPLYYGELGLFVFFACELLLRIWSAGGVLKYRTWVGRLIFISRPSIILDILTLFGFTISLATGLKTREFPSLTLKFLPPLQMIRFLRVDRQLSSWKILKGIIVTHRQELTVTLVIAFMFLITGSYLLYVAETPMDPTLNKGNFKSIADTMWFSIITMTTIGFGDLFPTTYIAKMITTTICFLGVAFWCLPAVIIGSGLAIQVQEKKRDEALSRLVPAAATVIRNWWRLRCVHHRDRFVSTWKIYSIIPRRTHVHPSLKPNLEKAASIVESTEQTPTAVDPSRFHFINLPTPTTQSNHMRRKSITSIEDLPKRYVTAIKIIRTLKYSVACKKFQEAKRPIDIKDVVKENTQTNNRLSTMLVDIQRRLDLVLGTTKPASYLSDVEKRQLSLSARIEKVEEIAKRFETKLNQLEQLASSLIKNG